MPSRLIVWAVALLGLIPFSAFAQEIPAHSDAGPSDHGVQVRLYWENDSPYFKPENDTDRYYTNGSGLSVALQPKPDWAVGLTAAQLIFTPGNIRARSLILDDRPYAGYLYGGGFLQHQSEQFGLPTLDHAQLDLGIVGPSALGENAQKLVHRTLDIDAPRGWDNQLRDEFTVQLALRKSWRLDLLREDESPIAMQLIPEGGLAVGNVFRHVEGSAVLRAGWNLPDDFGPGRLTHLGSFTGQVRRGGRGHLPEAWSLYGFGRVTGRAVEHNLLLEGNTWRDSHHVDAQPLVGELELGLVLTYAWGRWSAELGYSQTFVTEEFEGQDGGHAFGAWTLGLTGWF